MNKTTSLFSIVGLLALTSCSLDPVTDINAMQEAVLARQNELAAETASTSAYSEGYDDDHDDDHEEQEGEENEQSESSSTNTSAQQTGPTAPAGVSSTAWTAIQSHLSQHFSAASVVKVEQEDGEIEVKLNTGHEVYFTLSGTYIRTEN